MLMTCYMQMSREMDEILRQRIAQPANSCTFETENGTDVSFLDRVIFPIYDIVAAVSILIFLRILIKLFKLGK